MNGSQSPYVQIIATENMFNAWFNFRKGKKHKEDVMLFERHLEDNLFELQEELTSKTYRHSPYYEFFVHDPKKRHIHKPHIRDRVIHQLLYEYLYPLFNKTFIYDSYSCREKKGAHLGVRRLTKALRKESRNYSQNCWAVKCDVKKFFASIDHKILLEILRNKVSDADTFWLLSETISSFHTKGTPGKGIPLGNLTSQIFANIYMNELDQWIKHIHKRRYYFRYADDFVLVSQDKKSLDDLIEPIRLFLRDNLALQLHPDKIIFRRLEWGVDFLGYVVLPHYVLPRTRTKKRIFTKIRQRIGEHRTQKITDLQLHQCVRSYLGYLIHANTYTLSQQVKNYFWFQLSN